MYIAVIILGIIWAIIAKNMAEKKGKDGLVWLLLGFLFGWIAIIILACSPDKIPDKILVKTKRTHSTFDFQEAAYRVSEDQKPICMKCGNTLTKGPVCDMCGHENIMSSSIKRQRPSSIPHKEIPKVSKFKCKWCEETIDTIQCPWCGRKQYE